MEKRDLLNTIFYLILLFIISVIYLTGIHEFFPGRGNISYAVLLGVWVGFYFRTIRYALSKFSMKKSIITIIQILLIVIILISYYIFNKYLI
ncbi:MAG: hypothetical protein FH753_10400 [Firmicutes bacterium]|nr:hypothetical protein [Bacillota bacterium]